jgi:hypothetical protein
MVVFIIKHWKYFIFSLLAVIIIAFFIVFLDFSKPLSYLKFFQASLTSQISEIENQETDKGAKRTLIPSDSDGKTEEELSQEFDPVSEELVFVEPEEFPYKISNEDVQDQLDDIAEKIDILKQKVMELTGELNNEQEDDVDSEENEIEKEDNEENEEELEETVEEIQLVAETIIDNNVVPISPGYTVYPKILISEIQTSGAEDTKEEFVELYNPNEEDVFLNDWYIQRKTKTGTDYSSFVSKTLFSGKKIFTKSFFVICRQDYNPNGSCNIGITGSLAEDNSLVLKNPNREISDKVGWGEAHDFEVAPVQNPEPGTSIGRKWVENIEQDTNNNLNDFESQNLTPGSENTVYVDPVDPDPKLLEKVLINEIQIGEDERIVPQKTPLFIQYGLI